MKPDESLRQHLVELLTGASAHINFEGAIAGLPESLRGGKHPSVPPTPWRLVEHMRLAQWDILQFSIDPNHVSPEFPDGYWPKGDAPPDPLAWDRTVEAFRADLQQMVTLVQDPATDLYARIPHGDGQTILREALLIADHNAYHIGQLIVVRRLLGAWDEA
jgi:hypothetical protein